MTMENISEKYKKYKNNYKATENIKTISENINKRIEMLSLVNDELKKLSEELYYYNMVDFLGEIKTNTLNLTECNYTIKELEKAKIKFTTDDDKDYLKICDKIKIKIFLVGYELSKKIIKEKQKNEEFLIFFNMCENSTKEKLIKNYFKEKKKCLNKIIKECSENLERSYKLFIHGEIKSFIIIFGNIREKYSILFENYISEIFSLIFNKKNFEESKSILHQIFSNVNNISEEDNLFIIAYKNYIKLSKDKITKSEQYIEL